MRLSKKHLLNWFVGSKQILVNGLANLDVNNLKGYKNQYYDIYREEAYALHEVIIGNVHIKIYMAP